MAPTLPPQTGTDADSSNTDSNYVSDVTQPVSDWAETPAERFAKKLESSLLEQSQSHPHTPSQPNWASAPLPPAPPSLSPSQTPSSQETQPTPTSQEEEGDPEWANPRTPAQLQALSNEWLVPPTQPLFALLGPTVLPLQFGAGGWERGVRRVVSIWGVGEVEGKGERGKGGGGKAEGEGEEEGAKRGG
ncbi:hypothetical protein B0H34DRAFT_254546 [Crassisporium funariophilum]|nr:hypothetical protein B0H34DRAFT_254546 [Crassisporium funariophilum]